MICSIKAGKHRAKPLYWLRWFIWLWKPVIIQRQVCFTDKSKYLLPAEEQADWNKLFGISYSISVHKNSARFGWRFNPTANKFELSAYCYIKGIRTIEQLCELLPGVNYECQLLISAEDYIFRVTKKDDGTLLSSAAFAKYHSKKSGFLLGGYFGGNMKAPTKIIYELKKVKL